MQLHPQNTSRCSSSGAPRGSAAPGCPALRRRSPFCRVSSRHESGHETAPQQLHGALSHRFKLSELQWHPSTVIRNEALNVDGTVRLLHLSIPDNVEVLYGRKVQGVVDQPRWIDSYTMPGQSVAIKLPGGAVASRLYSIASTPYESRRDSSYIDASLIEIAAVRGEGADDDVLGQLGPGASLEVSQVIGRGFSSLLSSVNTFQLALEEGRPLLCIAVGTRGAVPIRALLSWTPVLAHATASKVSCLYACTNMTAAAFLPEWDAWREAGVNVQPVYTDGWEVDAAARSGDAAQHAQVVELLDKALFLREGGFNSLAGSGGEVVVLLAGVSGDVASSISKKLTARGVNHERILFADQF